MLVGSGGVLSHAPRRNQAALMLIDSFLPEGITELTVDSIFMMPQLGVLSTVHEKAATEVFEKDCLIRLGTCVAPIGKAKYGQDCMKVELVLPNGKTVTKDVKFGEVSLIRLGVGEKAKITVHLTKHFDMGNGKGKTYVGEVVGGVTGVILDARGRRPFMIPEDRDQRIKLLKEWHQALDVYPQY